MTVNDEELRGFVREQLGAFKVPKQIRVMSALPRAGKGLKRELRMVEATNTTLDGAK